MILNTLDQLGKFDAKGDEGTSSTNILGIQDVASQAVKTDVSSLRYIALLNWFHEADMETKNSDGLETKIPTVSSPVPTVFLDISLESSSDPRIISKGVFSHEETPSLGNALTLSNRFEDTFGEEADLSNMETSIPVSPTSTFRIHKDHPKRIHKDHPKSQIIGLVDTSVQTRHKSKEMEEQSFIATIYHKTNPKLLQFGLFLCFLSQEEPKKIFDALKDLSWMDVKSAFLYGTINEEVYVMQPPGFQDLEFLNRVYKVEKAMYELHQAPRVWYGTLSKYLLDNGFLRGQLILLWTRRILREKIDLGEGSAIPTEPHHTPSYQEQHSPYHDPSSPSHPTTSTEPIPQTPTKTPTATPTLRRYTRRAIRIAHSKALSPAADEPVSLLRDDRQGEAFPTISSLDARQDRENINKTSALPHESSPRVTSLDADEDKDRGSAKLTPEDAPIKGGIKETREEVGAKKSTKLGSNDSEEMVNVLSSIEAANILTNGVATASVSPAAGVPTVSGSFPTVSAIFTTASVGEGSATPTEPHHTPSPHEQHSPHHDPSSPAHPTTSTEPIPQTPTETPSETPTLRRYNRRAIQIAQSKVLSPASLLRDDRQGEAFLTVSSLDA
nr:retrovirus-related Pol polyprotein from transposon TNT 1-94 [Tanacetum cinerariifolium]